MRELTPQIQALADHYLDALVAACAETGEVDWIAELAGKLPMDVISEMMGVPDADRDEVRRLADLVVHREDGVRDVPEAGMTAAVELIGYYAEMVAQRRRQPSEDLTSALIEAEVDGDRLLDHEVIAFLFLMVVAGNETTTKLLGNALFHLGRPPRPARRGLRRSRGHRAGGPWIEETLRHDTSSQMLARYVAEDVELARRGRSRRVEAAGAARLGQPRRARLHRPRRLRHPSPEGRARQEPAASARVATSVSGANLARLEARVVLASWSSVRRGFEVARGPCRPRALRQACAGSPQLPVTFTRRAA